jgi:RHS repeat-associated protein
LIDSREVWRIADNGRVYRVAGNRNLDCNTPIYEGPARDITICSSTLAVGPDNSIYVRTNTSLMRIGPDGISRLVTGGPGAIFRADNVPALKSTLNSPLAVHVTPDGSLLVLDDAGGRVRLISQDGYIRTVVGYGERGLLPPEGALAKSTPLFFSSDAAMARDGSIYIGSGIQEIYRVAPALPGLSLGEFFVPSTDGRELYVFGTDGRHTRTRDAISLSDIYRFQYDSLGGLRAITDRSGLTTTIAVGSTGASKFIKSPYGVATTIELDANGYANALITPDGNRFRPAHDSLGLLRSSSDERGFPHRFDYDSLGNLIADRDTLGSQTLRATVTPTKLVVDHTDAAGRVASYSVEQADDESVTQVATHAGASPTSTTYSPNGASHVQIANRATLDNIAVADTRLGWPVSYNSAIDYRVGNNVFGSIRSAQRVVGAGIDALSASAILLDSVRVNGRLYTDSIDLGARAAKFSSPLGRQQSLKWDTNGNAVASQYWTRLPQLFTYNPTGQEVARTEGGRTDSTTYDSRGYVSRLRRSDGSTVTYQRDAFGRALQVSFDDTLPESFAYDTKGNLIRANRLGGREFVMTYDAHNRLTQDSIVGAALLGRYRYDGAYQLQSISRPGRNDLTFQYDSAGRPTYFGSQRTNTRMSYVNGADDDRLSGMIGSSGLTYGIQYDGLLPTLFTSSGLVNGSVAYGYTGNLWIRQTQISGRAPVNYAFDADGLMVQAGQLTISRDSTTGIVTGDSLGVVATSHYYNDHGELRYMEMRVSGRPTWTRAFTHDSLGRIASVRDSGAVGISTSGYRYDALNRLVGVTNNGQTALAFDFDLAGNRIRSVTASGVQQAQYSTDDRLLLNGGYAIANDSAGARVGEQQAQDTLTYAYDDVGRLVGVTSRKTGYTESRLDGMGRRVQELRNGVVVRSFLYGATRLPLAELDASGNLRTEFVYANGDDTPSYMIQGSTPIYILRDERGSVLMALNATTGTIVQDVHYDADGQMTSNSAPSQQPFGFAGGLVDIDGRFVTFGAREYDPKTARWLQADPIGMQGGSNRFAYAANDPVNYTDQTGLDPEGRPLTKCEKSLLKPYIPQIDLDNAQLTDGSVPWWLLSDKGGVTVYNNIYFRPGQYAPGTSAGTAALGHELTHVKQFRQGMTIPGYFWSAKGGYNNSPYEIEAYRVQNQIRRDLDNSKTKPCDCK